MNKYLEKIAVVSKLVKAQRRVAQILHTGSHDFKSMPIEHTVSALNEGKIHSGSWGTNGSGVYAGRGAPAHGYQPAGYTDRQIAFPGNPEHAVPHETNHRFHYNKMPVQDSVIPHEVSLSKGTYVSLPPGAKNLKNASLGERHMMSDMEQSIRKSRARRIYDDDIRSELKRRGLHDNKHGWDPVTAGDSKPKDVGNQYLEHLKNKLRETDVPRKDMRQAVRDASGTLADHRDYVVRTSRDHRDLRESLDYVARNHIVQSGNYRKYLKPD